MDFLNFKIKDKEYTQRTKFSKITISKNNKKQYITDNIDLLSTLERQIIEDAINILENPEQFFKYTTYQDDENAIYITDYIGKYTKNVVIPPYIDGKIVYGIDKIFQNNKEVERVILPDTVEQVFPETFKAMPNLVLVQLPSKITVIPYCMFKGCENLKYINLENINQINEYAFSACKSLEYVNLNSLNKIEQFGFAECKNLKSISLPNINSIDRYAFEKCYHLESATLNDELERIEQGVFTECKKLKDINLPNRLKSIAIMSFYKCKNITSINFPSELTTIAPSAFDESGLSGEIILPKNLKRIGQKAFFDTNIKKVKISKNTQYAEDSFTLDALLNLEYHEKDKIKETKEIEKER